MMQNSNDPRRPTASSVSGKTHPLLLPAALALILALILVAVFLAVQPFGKGPPNIILISVDTLRHDRMGYVGHLPEGKSPSPFLDTLAGEGAVFTRAASTSPWTLPGHYSLITGLPNELHEMIDDRIPLDPKIRSMAQHLKDQGYATGGFYSGPYLHPFFKFDRGFDMYESCMKQETMYDLMNYKWKDLSPEERKQMVVEKEMKSHLEVTSEDVTQKALFFARQNRENSLFIFLHYFDPHNDYIPPAPFNKRFDADYRGWVNGLGVVRDPKINPDMDARDLHKLKSLYDGEISWVDHNIRAFFDGLEKDAPEILENCLVVFTSDHGEEFFEHGRIGHRGNVYDTTLRIPLFFWGPGIVPEGVRIQDRVRIYDIYPTMLNLAGLPVPESLYGRSLDKLLRGGSLRPEPLVAELTYLPAEQEELYHKYFSFQFEQYKLIGFQIRDWSKDRPIDFTGALREERYELYDLDKDPEEQEDLFRKDPNLAKRLLEGYELEKERLRKKYVELHGSEGTGVSATELPDELKTMIEETGYGAGARDQSNK